MLHRLIRHHARAVLFTALLPYLAASLFVNFFHTDKIPEIARPAGHAITVVETAPASGRHPAQHPEGPCPACLWLKVGGTRIEPVIAIVPAFHRLDGTPAPVPVVVPLAPVRHRSSLRGPPSFVSL